MIWENFHWETRSVFIKNTSFIFDTQCYFCPIYGNFVFSKASEVIKSEIFHFVQYLFLKSLRNYFGRVNATTKETTILYVFRRGSCNFQEKFPIILQKSVSYFNCVNCTFFRVCVNFAPSACLRHCLSQSETFFQSENDDGNLYDTKFPIQNQKCLPLNVS